MRMQAALPLRFTGRLLGLALLIALLSSCALSPSGPQGPSPAELAEQARAQGDPTQALRRYRAILETTDQLTEQLVYRLRVADLHLDMGNPELAREELQHVPDEEQSQLVEDLQAVVLARLSLAEDSARRALSTIAARLPGHPDAQPRLLDVQARALRTLGRNLDSAESRSTLGPLLIWPRDMESNQLLLWETLQETPLQALREIMPPAPDTFGAWVELAFLVRTYRLDPQRLENELALWAGRYPDHPARENITGDVMARYRDEAQPVGKVVVLLPFSGPLASAGRAVRDGMLAAYYQATGKDTDHQALDRANRPELLFRDVGEDGDDPWAAYLEAVQEGADLVVGPLSRPSVEVFAIGRSLPVPVMALNAIPAEAEPPANLYRFGLLPEDEARAAARHAARQGLRHAVVLVPTGSWGTRVREAFSSAFQDHGGVTLEYETYLDDDRDFSDPLRRLLDLDASQNRERRLRSTIRRGVEFEPRRRQDVDLVFTGAFPQQARLIRPQVRFHHGIGLPVMATANVHSGRPDDGDQDLEGLIFFDMPWILADNPDLGPTRTDLARYWSDELANNGRLFAMGLDAYRLMPYLAVLRSNPGETLDGATGVLRIDGSGQIRRDLLPAQFTRNRVEPIRPAQP